MLLKREEQGIPWQSGDWDSMLSLPRALAQSLVGELRVHRLCGMAKNKKREREEETPALPLSAMWGYRERLAICKQGSRLSPEIKLANTLIFDPQLQNSEKINVFYFSHLVYGILLEQPKLMRTQAEEAS